jgi:gliding motility-associated protein GldM
MAGGKETPRQKMIGLMYLVLMALLAMNVSKEIINAFITLDKKLQSSNGAFVTKAMAAYSRIEAAKTVSPNPINNFWKEKADRVAALAEATNEYIFDLKASMLAEAAEGPGADKMRWVVVDEDGTKRIKDLADPLDEYQKKEDYDTPTRLYGGAAGTPGYTKGAEIRQRIHSYRDSLLKELAEVYGSKATFDIPLTEDPSSFYSQLSKFEPKDTTVLVSLYKNLTQPEKMLNHGQEQAWQLVMFDHAPVVAASAMFTSIQNDIRDAQASAMEFLATKVEAPPVKFNAVAPLALGLPYVNEGDSLNVKVMIAAYDSTSTVKAFYSMDDSTMKNRIDAKPMRGYAGISMKPSSLGEHRLDGKIVVTRNGKDDEIPWSFEYQVGAPNASVSPLDLNVLYASWENRIEVSASGFPPESIQVTCSGCTISKKGKEYIAKPSGGAKKATISVSSNAGGKSTQIAQKEFRVFPLPKPSAFFGGQTGDVPTISAAQAKSQGKLFAMLKDSPLNVPYEVVGFEMIIPQKDGTLKPVKTVGSNLNGEMKAALAKMNRGQVIMFTSIDVKGPAPKPIRISGLTFRII